MQKIALGLLCLAAVFLVAIVTTGTKAEAKSSYFSSQCGGCHYDDSTSCAGCHAHGVHSSIGGSDINLVAATDKDTYTPGEAMTVSFDGGTNQNGWIRAILYDENGVEITSSSGPGGTGSGEEFPILFSATAPSTPGTYTYSASWFGNSYDRSSAAFGDWRPASMSGHGEEVVQTNSFVVEEPVVLTPDIAISDSVSPSTDLMVPFGSITEGASSSQTVTVSNQGDADLNVGTIGSLSAPFAISADNCSGVTLPPAASCSLTVSFSPSSARSYTDSFSISSDDPDESSVTVSVSGSATAAPVADISVSDSVAPSTDLQIPFGSITAGDSASQTVTISNQGNANLNIGTLGTLSAPFALSADNCSGKTLAAGAGCSATVSFSPSSAGSYTDSFSISSNDPDESSVTISVSGSASSAPVADISVSDSVAPASDLSVPFGSLVSGSSAVQTVTVSNQGNANLTIGSVAGSDPLSSPFSIATDGCSGSVLVPSAACNITLEFAPIGEGSYTDSFNVPSDDPDENSVTVSVSGSSTAVPVADITVSGPASFGSVMAGSSAERTVTVTNDGGADLYIWNVAVSDQLSDPFSISADGCSGATLLAGESCSVTVLFNPSTEGTYNDSFEVSSSDPDEGTVSVSVSGSSSTPGAGNADIVIGRCGSTSDTSMLFGSARVGKSKSRTLTVSSCGDTDLEVGAIGLADPVEAPFTVTEDLCSNSVLAPGTSCTVSLAFSPDTAGNATGSFDIPSNDSDQGAVYIALNGRGLDAGQNHPPDKPKPIKPGNGDEVDSGNTLFEWYECEDPDGDDVEYEIEVSEEASFEHNAVSAIVASALSEKGGMFAGTTGLAAMLIGIALSGPTRRRKIVALIAAMALLASFALVSCSGGGSDSSSSGGTVSTSTLSYFVDSLEPGKTYYWKVTATDPEGASTESDVLTFTTR